MLRTRLEELFIYWETYFPNLHPYPSTASGCIADREMEGLTKGDYLFISHSDLMYFYIPIKKHNIFHKGEYSHRKFSEGKDFVILFNPNKQEILITVNGMTLRFFPDDDILVGYKEEKSQLVAAHIQYVLNPNHLDNEHGNIFNVNRDGNELLLVCENVNVEPIMEWLRDNISNLCLIGRSVIFITDPAKLPTTPTVLFNKTLFI